MHWNSDSSHNPRVKLRIPKTASGLKGLSTKDAVTYYKAHWGNVIGIFGDVNKNDLIWGCPCSALHFTLSQQPYPEVKQRGRAKWQGHGMHWDWASVSFEPARSEIVFGS